MTKLGPHGHSKLAVYLRARLAELAPIKNQTEIAREAGFTNPNMISMLKQGTTKLALDRVAALARALEVDPRRCYLLALDQNGHATTARNREDLQRHRDEERGRVARGHPRGLGPLRPGAHQAGPHGDLRHLWVVREQGMLIGFPWRFVDGDWCSAR